MNAALTMDFPYVQQNEIKIINFTSNAVGGCEKHTLDIPIYYHIAFLLYSFPALR